MPPAIVIYEALNYLTEKRGMRLIGVDDGKPPGDVCVYGRFRADVT